ncbi:MAG: DHH family phosphoesterase [Candidatus Edwardsbacteria bacterium]|nr:DHH family phosphoesterase [Candidatus Edwardsbacteria bacterium]
MTRASQAIPDPGGWQALTTAAEVVAAALGRGRGVCVWGHDDIDGAAATAIIRSALPAGADVGYYIPPRSGAHYGLDAEVIGRLAAAGTGLIITADCGISNAAEADYARTKGVALVITDHHELPSALPLADAVVNPKLGGPGSPGPDLCGAAVALYLAAQLTGATAGDWLAADRRRLAWAALATVSDRVPLRDENRPILAAGMAAMAAEPVFRAVAGEIGLDLGRGLSHRIIAGHFVALLAGMASEGPRHPVVELLGGAVDPALVRQQWTAQRRWRERLAAQAEAKKGRLNPARDSVNLVVDEQLPPEMIGPLAGRLREATGFPAVVIGLKNGLHVGECRGFEPFDCAAMLRELAANFVQSGGHKQAAGFTVKPDRLGETLVAIEEYADGRKEQIAAARPRPEPVRSFATPAELAAGAAELAGGAPYGPGNPEPVCRIEALPQDCAAGSSCWLDDLLSRAGGPARPTDVAVDVTHTGSISLRALS